MPEACALCELTNLQSIDLTQLPAHKSPTGKESESAAPEPAIEYSSKEVSPPDLLLQQLVRAYNVFLLHHGATLGVLFRKVERTKFCNMLDKYWTRFANNWDVLLHGSPAVDMYNGMKLAAGGELGMGVGEEEWGSGERLVLEDFVQKTDGLVDFMVSRFGEPSPLQDPKKASSSKEPVEASDLEPWIGSGQSPSASDGIVFSGVGAISRRSLRDLSHWIESIYCYGEHAYGVRDNPTADRRKRRRRNLRPPSTDTRSPDVNKSREPCAANTGSNLPPGIPPPIVKAAETSLDKASAAVETTNDPEANRPELLTSLGDTETWMKYLTLGYGTAWGARRGPSGDQTPAQEPSDAVETPEAPMRYVEPQPDIDSAAEKLKTQVQHENTGYFLIGLKGDMEEEDIDDENDGGAWNNRTLLRTVHVELTKEIGPETPGSDIIDTLAYEREMNLENVPQRRLSRIRPVVYIVSLGLSLFH